MREEQEEEEAVTSNGMNDDDKANINSRSDFDSNRIGDGDDNCNLNQISQVWGTWEELVLTCAVKRHGLSDWDSVAKEVRTRSRSSSLTAVSAGNCSLKYQDLKRRFQDSGDDGERNSEAAAAAEEDGVGEITWIEKLRKLRVVELRREVQRCDDSIRSLQIKVKKLEEEKEGDDGDKKPDLKDDAKAVKSRSNEIDEPAKINRETTESDRENRSMNESNSTASVDKIADHERLRGDKTIQACKKSKNPDPDPVNKAAGEEEGTVSMRSGMSHSGELVESGTSTVPAKKKAKKHRSGEDSGIRGGSGGDIKSTGNKSQPLIEIIKLIRSHPRGSVFESRLRSQETKDYKRLIKQHLDIKTIEKKLKKGAYVSSSNLCFYRDIKLLFTNAIVFFPPSSSESKAAHELRTLVSNEIKKQTRKPVIKTEPVLSVSKQKSSVPPLPSLVVCKKKKSSDLKKTTSPSSSSFKQKDEKSKKKSQEVSEEKKTVTTTTSGARSSRKTNDVVVKDNKTGRGNKKQTESKADSSDDDDDREESRKTEKKKKTVEVDKKKKKSVVDFLKRIEKNSPEKEKEIRMSKEHHDQKKKSGGIGNGKKESNGKAKPRELRSSSTGKNNGNNKSSSKQRKEPKEEPAEAGTGKRSRESSGKEDKQPKKRSRR